MNYTTPPGLNDFETLAAAILDVMPDELSENCENLSIRVEDFPDDAIQADMDIDDPYELLALYKGGGDLSSGVERKNVDDEDVLILFRRPILDVWCENCEDITGLMREVMIEEIARSLNFTEDEIEDMTSRHSQQLF